MASTTSKYKFDKELVDVLRNPPKPVCNLGKIISEHPNGKDIEAAVKDQRWSAMQLAPVLSKRLGQSIGSGAVTGHRNQTCLCFRGV
jgi:hypothetical protein